MAKKRRPCPRGLYDGCPIPRELCSEDFERTGQWHCLKFLKEFEWFVFGTGEIETLVSDVEQGESIVSMDELMRVLEGMEGET
ncbi:MAG: hypothetical protein ACI8V2_002089 [Candidatus Latescibacterota bacterium]|jgi:hypothetical protein